MLRSSPFQKRLTKNNSAFSHCIRVPDAFHGVSIYFWVGGVVNLIFMNFGVILGCFCDCYF